MVVSRRCQELVLEVVYVSMVLIHCGNAVQSHLCYSFSQVIVEESVFYCFSSTESILLHVRELGPVVDCIWNNVLGYKTILFFLEEFASGPECQPLRVCHYWEGTGLRNSHCDLRAAGSVDVHLSKAFTPGSQGDLLCLLALATEAAQSVEAEEETTKSIGLAILNRTELLNPYLDA